MSHIKYILSIVTLAFLVITNSVIAGDKLGDLSCSNDQVAKFDSASGNWVCADDKDTGTLGRLPCTIYQVPKVNGAGQWACGNDNDSTTAHAPSLLAYYPFESDVRDATQNGNDGTVGGTERYDVGHDGGGFSFLFDGATFISTRLDIGVDVQPQLTMGAWVKPAAGTTFYGQVLTHDDQGYDRSIIHYGSDWRAYDGPDGGSVYTGFQPASDDWQFVAVVYDQDRASVTLYVDGVAATKNQQVLGPSVNTLHMGYNPSNHVEFFQGLVDEVFIVSGALVPDELNQIRTNGVRSLFPPLGP